MERSDIQSCLFCHLVARQLPISFVAETEDVLAFLDIQPVNPGHILVIPKRHASNLADLDQPLAGQIFAMGMRLAAALRASPLRCEGINLFLADGEAAGQEVFHAHLHVFPRFAGDGFGLKHGPNYSVLPARSELDDIAKKLQQAMPA